METGYNHKYNCKCAKCHLQFKRGSPWKLADKPNAWKFLQAQKAIAEHNSAQLNSIRAIL